MIKSALEGKSPESPLNTNSAQEDSHKSEARYGQLGSIRMDAYENIPEKSTVCTYDPKTGWRGLSFPRMNELAAAAHRLFGYRPRYIIVTEVRPGKHRSAPPEARSQAHADAASSPKMPKPSLCRYS